MSRGILTLYKGGVYEAKLLMSFNADMAESSGIDIVAVDNDGAGYTYKYFIENYKRLTLNSNPVFIYVKHKLPPKALVDAIKYMLDSGSNISMIACTDGLYLDSMSDVIYEVYVDIVGKNRTMKINYSVLKNRLSNKLKRII